MKIKCENCGKILNEHLEPCPKCNSEAYHLKIGDDVTDEVWKGQERWN